MGKVATVTTVVNKETKREAEEIFRELGIPMSSAIPALLKAVVRHKGIPIVRIEGVVPPYLY